MSSVYSSYSNRDGESIKILSSPSLVQLNDVLQSSLQEYQKEITKGNIIIRCDSLPIVEGNAQQLEKLFSNIISIIFDTHINNCKQYLHVNCLEDEIEVIGLSSKKGYKLFEILFKTNLNCELIWRRTEQEKIDECKAILDAHNGKMESNFVRGTGCLLSIILPGKLQ